MFAALRIVGPLLGKEQTVVEQGVTVAAGIAEKDTNLTVIDLAKPAAILAFDAAGMIPFLGEARAITEEDAVGVVPDLGYLLADLSEDELIVPGRDAKEVLKDFATHAKMVSDGLSCFA